MHTYIEDTLNFVIVADSSKYSHVVEYKVYEIIGEHEDGSFSYHKEEENGFHPNIVYTIEEATPYLDGSVKWDGCSNWNFCYPMMLHFCGRGKFENLGKVMAKCWDLTKELCPNWVDL